MNQNLQEALTQFLIALTNLAVRVNAILEQEIQDHENRQG